MSSILSLLDKINGKISVIGSMNVDYTVMTERLPQPGETVVGGSLCLLPGGKSGNQAAQASKLGAIVHMFGAVGTDSNASFLMEKLQQAGVNTEYIRHVDGASGTTVIAVDKNGENTIIYSPGSNAQVLPEYITSMRDHIVDAQAVGLCLESPIESVVLTARYAHEKGIPVLLNNSPFTPNLPDELIKFADILLVNEHEMAQLLHIVPPSDDDWQRADWGSITQSMSDYGFSTAIITLGAEGAIVIENGSYTKITPVQISAKDTTGCGDSFMATVLAGIASGFTLVDSAQLASYVAGYAATGYGAQASYGNVEEVRKMYENNAN